MRLTGVIAGLVVVASFSGILPVRGVDPNTVWKGKVFAERGVAGTAALSTGQYGKAVELLSAGADAARRAGDWVSQGRFLLNQGGGHMMLEENRLAIRCLLAGREAAAKASDLLTLQAIEASLANVYVLTGDYDAAGAAADRGAAIRPETADRERQARTLMSFGRAMAKARGVEAAAPIWREALAEAEAAGSRSLEAGILDLWGYELSEQEGGRGGEAEELLARSWYKRKLGKDDRMPLTEGKLARLTLPSSTIRAIESLRSAFISSWTFR